MFLATSTNLLYDALLTVIYPQSCRLCGLSVESRIFGVVCERCWRSTTIFTGSELICSKCGVLGEGMVAANSEPRCGKCDVHAFASARACGVYEGALRESVLLLKRQSHIPKYLESIIIQSARRLDKHSLLIPVPLHSERIRARGFNQAHLITQIVSEALVQPVDLVSLVRTNASEKYRAGLDARGRQETVSGSFAVQHPRLVLDQDILLIDDVFTTGATASACADVLLAAGARSVAVFTIARSPW